MLKKMLFTVILALSRSFVMPPVNNFNNLQEFIHTIPYEYRVKIVEEATGILPKLDFFGHMVLSNNEKIIDYIIHTPLTEEQKKVIILKVIELCRQGDQMGGKILLNYYNLIDNVL